MCVLAGKQLVGHLNDAADGRHEVIRELNGAQVGRELQRPDGPLGALYGHRAVRGQKTPQVAVRDCTRQPGTRRVG